MESHMKKMPIVALLVGALVSLSTSAFASGYGPAPFYRPSVGAPASQRGQSVATISVEQQNGVDAQRAYGGVTAGSSQSSGRAAVAHQGNVYAHHLSR